jgi:oligopeptide transport system substrate-binding protein
VNRALILLTVLCLASLLPGCVRSGSRAELVIVNGAEPETLDPALVTGQPDLRIVSAMFEGLTRNDPQTGAPIPGLAERWTISGDGCVYTFHLRTNAVWSTGGPITTADFVYSWRRVLSPETAADYAGQLYYVKNAAAYNSGQIRDPSQVGFEAVDAQTFRVILQQPTAFFLDLCALPALAVVPRETIERYGERWLLAGNLPVSGPYQLEQWRINDKVRLRKNPLYWDAAQTHLETIDILPIGSPITALNLYETGAADVVWDKGLVPTELLDVLIRRPDFHRFDYLATYFLRINTTRKPFQDPRVRRALAMAIDKERIVRKITRAGEKIAQHLTPPGIASYTPPEGLAYNPALARQLLAEAGFPNGQDFPVFRYLFNAAAGGSSRLHAKIAIEIQQMWKEELGLDVELRQVEWKVFLAAQTALDYDVCWSSWIGDYNDANTFLDLFMSQNGNNRTGWKHEGYDELMNQANRETDRALRARLLQQAEQILAVEALPIIPLYFYVGLSYYDGQRIEGIYPNLIDQHPLNAIRIRR